MKNKINFIKTSDDSTGLFSNEKNDIFHSKTGALTEAYDKFVNPVVDFIKNKNDLYVLDICYGIGYNSKALLYKIPNKHVHIDALEFYEDYIFLSPFIEDGINNCSLNLFLISQIEKVFSKNIIITKLHELFNENEEYFSINNDFFDLVNAKIPYKNILHASNNSFLHNIYYSYISNRATDNIDINSYKNSTINFFTGDARKSIKTNSCTYDIVFLDAFSPQKDPTLWTIDFLSLVKSKMNINSLLLSYSKSTPFRSALIELGFYVGKTFINNIDMGTIASLNPDYILNPLSEYDLKLIETRSGITYKDSNFSLSSDEILQNREIESKNSERISHTKFLKLYLN